LYIRLYQFWSNRRNHTDMVRV